jgi:hypothetical protein
MNLRGFGPFRVGSLPHEEGADPYGLSADSRVPPFRRVNPPAGYFFTSKPPILSRRPTGLSERAIPLLLTEGGTPFRSAGVLGVGGAVSGPVMTGLGAFRKARREPGSF